MALNQIFKWLAMGLLSSALGGCFGGTVAEQLARSVLMQGADKITASALEAKEKNDKVAGQPFQQQSPQPQYPLQQLPSETKTLYKDTTPDPYRMAFINSGFETIAPQVQPLPENVAEEETPIQSIHETRLVQVEVWSLLVGDEKNRVLEKARLQGSTTIPPKNEWKKWQLAVGAETDQASKDLREITFLVPPEMGKIHSGTKAVVELSTAGELNIARYAAN
jgi:hypothetical protein